MEMTETQVARKLFHDKIDDAVDAMVEVVMSNPGWEDDDEFMEIFDAVVSDDSEAPILVGKEVARRLDKPYPFG